MNTRIVAIGIIALVLIVLFGSLFGGFIVSGYGGISSRVNAVEHPFVDNQYVDTTITETHVTMIPYSFGSVGATGIKLELGQPQYTGEDLRYTNKVVEETDDGTLVRNWEVRIVYFDLSWTISSTGGGDYPILDVIFWIELKENEFDVFTAADEVEAYILEVVTTETVDINDPVNVKVTPEASGFNLDLETLDSKPIPSWMTDAGYQGILSELKNVRFSFTVDSLQPTRILHMRYENGATWKTQVRVLVFGFWEVLSPYDEWEFDFFGWLDFLGDFALIVMVIIGLVIGIIATAVILKFVPDKRLAAIILLLIWIFVIFAFGFLELLF